MAGRHKAFIQVGGRPVIDRLTETLEQFFDEILIVTRQTNLFENSPYRVVGDLYIARTSLTGIHAGLKQAAARFAMVVPCDVPFLQPALVRLLLDEMTPACDVVIPVIHNYFEPLCAIYSKRCLPAIEASLDSGVYKITRFFDQVHVKTVPQERVQSADPELLSFLNANTPEQFAILKKMSLQQEGNT